MRNNFFDTLFEDFKKNENIYLLTGDIGYSVLEKFQEFDKKRFINAGIAEQNMIGLAAGLAHEGKIVYVYSIGNFSSLRCLEQIRYDICYHEKNVKIISVGAGFAYGQLGASHHATEDLAIMRSIPNMIVCNPSDSIEAKKICRLSVDNAKPMYIRLNKSNEPIIHVNELDNLNIGDILSVNDDNFDYSIFTTGQIAEKINQKITKEGKKVSLYIFPFLNNIDKDKFSKIVNKHKKIMTVEENQLNGGFGSFILELISDCKESNKIYNDFELKRIGINNIFTTVNGSQEYLRKINSIEIDFNWFEKK